MTTPFGTNIPTAQEINNSIAYLNKRAQSDHEDGNLIEAADIIASLMAQLEEARETIEEISALSEYEAHGIARDYLKGIAKP